MPQPKQIMTRYSEIVACPRGRWSGAGDGELAPASGGAPAARRRDRHRGHWSYRGARPACELADGDVLARSRAVSQPGSSLAAAAAAISSREIDAARRVENRLRAGHRAAQCSANGRPAAGCSRNSPAAARCRRSDRLDSAPPAWSSRAASLSSPRRRGSQPSLEGCTALSRAAQRSSPRHSPATAELDGAVPPSNLDAAPAPPRSRRRRHEPPAAAATASRRASMS